VPFSELGEKLASFAPINATGVHLNIVCMHLTHTKEETIPRRYALASTLTIAQLAKELNISRRHVYSLMAQRLIPYTKHGGRVCFRCEAVNHAIERLTVHSSRTK
jgi:excisionase family DNA binding protein